MVLWIMYMQGGIPVFKHRHQAYIAVHAYVCVQDNNTITLFKTIY